MEKVANLFTPHLHKEQIEKLSEYDRGLREFLGTDMDLEKQAGFGREALNIAKSFLFPAAKLMAPVAAGGAAGYFGRKIQEKKEGNRMKDLQEQIKINRAALLANTKHYSEKEQDFSNVFKDIATMAPNVAANSMMIERIMDQYGPHTEHNLELMQLEALKSLDQKMQDITHAQKRINSSVQSAQAIGESIAETMMVDDLTKVSGIDYSPEKALVKVASSQAILLEKFSASGKMGSKIMKYMKDFAKAIAPGVAVSSIPALGYMYMEKKKADELNEQIQKSYKIVKNNETIQQTMGPEQVDDAFNAIAEFAPTLAKNPAAATTAVLTAQGAEGLNPQFLKNLSDIEKIHTDIQSRKPNAMRDYMLPSLALGTAAFGVGAAHQKTMRGMYDADLAGMERDRGADAY